MLGLSIAAVMLYGYRMHIEKSTTTLLCMIAACTALVNQAVQVGWSGLPGIGASLLIAGLAVVFLTKGFGR